MKIPSPKVDGINYLVHEVDGSSIQDVNSIQVHKVDDSTGEDENYTP